MVVVAVIWLDGSDGHVMAAMDKSTSLNSFGPTKIRFTESILIAAKWCDMKFSSFTLTKLVYKQSRRLKNINPVLD